MWIRCPQPVIFPCWGAYPRGQTLANKQTTKLDTMGCGVLGFQSTITRKHLQPIHVILIEKKSGGSVYVE